MYMLQDFNSTLTIYFNRDKICLHMSNNGELKNKGDWYEQGIYYSFGISTKFKD